MSDAPENPVQHSQIRTWEDRAIQDLLDSPQNLEDLLKLASATLTEKLDFRRMVRTDRRHLLPDLRKLESDLVFEVPFREGNGFVWIYILLEHQSEPDRTMPLRLLGYMIPLWQEQIRQFEENAALDWHLHPILPVLFYTGSGRWTLSLQLEGLMHVPEELARYVPHFDTLFLSLREKRAEELTGSALAYGLRALQEADSPDAAFIQGLQEALHGLDGLSETNRTAWEAVLLFLYRMVVHHRNPHELQVLVQLAEQELTSERRQKMEEIVMTGAEMLINQGVERGIQQGVEIGIEKGIQQGVHLGVQQGKLEILLRQANRKFGTISKTVRSRISQLSPVQLEELTDAILDLPDLPALKSWLQAHERS